MEGALHVFANKGFENATNKEIAQAARIRSPGLIYHYFKDKRDLFSQVMETYAPALHLISRGDEFMDRPPREVLTMFAESFADTVDNRVALAMFRMMLGESLRRPSVAMMFNAIGPGRGFAFLMRYLEHQMDKGTLKRMNPGIAARCFIGPLVAYVITREVFVQPDASHLGSKEMVDSAVDIFLQGMEVRDTK
jgi:AcrR family transcriptional regulator